MSPQPRQAEPARLSRKQPAPRRWLSVREAAERSGFSVRAIRERIAEGQLPAYCPRGSRVLRIDIRDLDGWITSGGRLPTAHLGNGEAAQ
jgi:excisionase family DNA binding protein